MIITKDEKVMDLFETILAEPINILPSDGEVHYHGEILKYQESDYYYNSLLNEVEWRCDQAIIFGKKIKTKRKVAWYAEQAFEYTYSNVTKRALPWTPSILALKAKVEQHTGESFNSCLLNLYHTGEEAMAWHSDGEADLKKNGAIASLSLGATRKFAFKHKQSKQVIDLLLKPGSLLVMKGVTQQYWLHRLPPTKKIHQARINLTFRTIETKPRGNGS
ncbi:alpha-ketoglutarate-dependent dioxygenase AlkB [Colwellia sp. KU-HH00111]|uniref:alpha-ketoglutarate-dependent dioxygenase AlkB family protein n=1 Tax=Colwellia sp. KU-HH00111 TaxID=3127652 RepID=UPI00310C435B